MYDSIKLSCKKFSWQVIFISPFELPEELKKENNIRLIKIYSSVPICIQKGILEADGELIFSSVDDCTFSEDSIDIAIDLWNSKDGEFQPTWGKGEITAVGVRNTIISMIYRRRWKLNGSKILVNGNTRRSSPTRYSTRI